VNTACMADGVESCMHTVDRGLQVLRSFRCERTPLSNAEIARRTGLPKATVHRFTNTLVELGYLRQCAKSRKFELDAASIGIGHAYLARSRVVQRAKPLLQTLADRLQVSVGLGLRDDLEVLYLGYTAGSKVQTLRKSVGGTVPLFATAIGHACLWALDADERAPLLPRLRQRAGERAESLDRAMCASFAQLQDAGLCWSFGHYQRGVWGLATPMRLGSTSQLLVLGCGKVDAAADAAIERARVGPALLETAAQLRALAADLDGAL
jgi:DNA-binding IclR family transcriptional regulator